MANPLVPPVPDLAKYLGELLAQVPAGRVTTYGRLAHALGDSIASRWVGYFGLHHRHGRDCICDHVVRATGHLGLYTAGDTADKARRLSSEGVKIEGTRPQDMRVDLMEELL